MLIIQAEPCKWDHLNIFVILIDMKELCLQKLADIAGTTMLRQFFSFFFQGDGGFSKISRSLLLFRVDQHNGYSDDFNFLRCKVILYEIYAKENFAWMFLKGGWLSRVRDTRKDWILGIMVRKNDILSPKILDKYVSRM